MATSEFSLHFKSLAGFCELLTKTLSPAPHAAAGDGAAGQAGTAATKAAVLKRPAARQQQPMKKKKDKK